MEIRGARTWCPTCTAPVVYPENVAPIRLFLAALPAWRTTGMERIAEGFDRSEVLSLMALTAVPAAEIPATWEALAELEAELARIRAARRAKEHPHGQ
jgi:hypothetical protein